MVGLYVHEGRVPLDIDVVGWAQGRLKSRWVGRWRADESGKVDARS